MSLLKIRSLSLLVVAAAFSSVAACQKNPAEQTASAQTPAAQQAETAPPPPKPMPAQLPDVLARVNGQPVTKTDFDRLVKNMEAGRGAIPAEHRDTVLRGALDQLITYSVLKQEAAARKFAVSDTDVDGQVASMQKQFPTQAEFDKALAARNTTVEQLKADARIDMAINKMMEAEVAAAVAANDAEAKDFYDKNPDKFTQPESARASHILLMTEKLDDAGKKAARAKIEALLKRARAGEDFAALAKANSDDGSASQGGDLGFFPHGRMVPEFDKAAFALKPGEISDVVTSQFGYHIIKLTEKKEASTVPFDQVKPQVLEYLTNQKKQQRVDSFIEEAKKRAKIEVLV
jgi:peptidyl-prolyl cis-trans isomerase C